MNDQRETSVTTTTTTVANSAVAETAVSETGAKAIAETGAEPANSTAPEAAETAWDDVHTRAALEALLLAADEPLSTALIQTLLPHADESTIRRSLAQMQLEWAGGARGIWLIEVAGGFQFRTNPAFQNAVLGLYQAKPTKLSRAAMETLAVIAYRQPVTRSAIDEIRGVDCTAAIRGLMDLELITTLGKADDIGRPNLYGTTRRFLEYFGLVSLTELPTLTEVDALELFGQDVSELIGEQSGE